MGGSKWIYDDSDVKAYAESTGEYALKAGVFDGDYGADFHAIDRYEADDLTLRSYWNSYCYGAAHEWPRFFDFVKWLSRRLKKPVMPWQYPASRLPDTSDAVADSFDSQNWGTGGSYLFGQPEIGSNAENINATVRNFRLPAHFPAPYANEPVSALFTRGPFDLSQPTYSDFPLRGIFSVQLGGGATTGMVRDIGKTGPWTGAKVAAYMDNPIPLRTAK